MARFSLTVEELKELERLSGISSDIDDLDVINRIDALKRLHYGWTIEGVAKRHKVNRRTVYNWKRRFLENPSLPILERLTDKPRSGRPKKTLTGLIDNVGKLVRSQVKFLEEHDPIAAKIYEREIINTIAKAMMEETAIQEEEKSPHNRGDE